MQTAKQLDICPHAPARRHQQILEIQLLVNDNDPKPTPHWSGLTSLDS